MADNFTIKDAGGATVTFASDEISSAQYQRVKLSLGSDGSAVDAPGDGTSGIWVNIKNASLAVTGTFWQATQPVSASSLPLPTGAATETSLATVAGAVSSSAMQVAAKATNKWKWSFAKVVASGVDTLYATVLRTGSGMAVSQSGGNLVITTGTTTYSETVIRSNSSQSGSGIFRYAMQLSQRIANQNFAIEWVDVVGDSLSMTINSATSVTVTKTAHGFTSGDIGKGLWIGSLSVASCLTQRAVIASIPSADTITLTVSGFPVSGSGTCSLFGYNYYQVIYSGTTATSLGTGFTTQRLGWANTAVDATINTTDSSGHIGIIETSRNNDCSYLDQIPGTGTGVQATVRGAFNQNVPDVDTPLYLQIRVWNGSSAPSGTTTMTVGFVDVESYSPLMVNLAGVQSIGYKNAIPVSIERSTSTQPVSGTVTAGLSASVNLVGDVGTQYRANATGAASTVSILSPATAAGASIKGSAGRLLGFILTNTAASMRSFKVFNATSVTMGTTAAVFEVDIPAGQSIVWKLEGGIGFATGIMWAVTSAKGLTDNTNTGLAANDVSGVAIYA